MRVKQSISRQIVANAYPSASATFAMRSDRFHPELPAVLFADRTAPRQQGARANGTSSDERAPIRLDCIETSAKSGGGDGLLVPICRRRQTVERGNDLDHEPQWLAELRGAWSRSSLTGSRFPPTKMRAFIDLAVPRLKRCLRGAPTACFLGGTFGSKNRPDHSDLNSAHRARK